MGFLKQLASGLTKGKEPQAPTIGLNERTILGTIASAAEVDYESGISNLTQQIHIVRPLLEQKQLLTDEWRARADEIQQEWEPTYESIIQGKIWTAHELFKMYIEYLVSIGIGNTGLPQECLLFLENLQILIEMDPNFFNHSDSETIVQSFFFATHSIRARNDLLGAYPTGADEARIKAEFMQTLMSMNSGLNQASAEAYTDAHFQVDRLTIAYPELIGKINESIHDFINQLIFGTKLVLSIALEMLPDEKQEFAEVIASVQHKVQLQEQNKQQINAIDIQLKQIAVGD